MRGSIFTIGTSANCGFEMAPLLGRKPYPLAKPLAEPPGPGEEVYIIEHSKEAFRNKEYPFNMVLMLRLDILSSRRVALLLLSTW